MIIHWQRVGFVHGVMNTDNLSILGNSARGVHETLFVNSSKDSFM